MSPDPNNFKIDLDEYCMDHEDRCMLVISKTMDQGVKTMGHHMNGSLINNIQNVS